MDYQKIYEKMKSFKRSEDFQINFVSPTFTQLLTVVEAKEPIPAKKLSWVYPDFSVKYRAVK
jgi:hypothetical protein